MPDQTATTRRPATIAEASQLAYDAVMRRTGDDTEAADLIRRGVLDAYRTGWNRALAGHPDEPDAESGGVCDLREYYVNADDGYRWLYHLPNPDEEEIGHLVRGIDAGDTLADLMKATGDHTCEATDV